MRKSLLALALVSATAASIVAQSRDWNQWRGPNRDGLFAGFTTPSAWPDRPKQLWKVGAGIGHSSPVVSGNRVFLFSRIGEQEAMTAYDATTGKQVWQQRYDAPYRMTPAASGHGKGPKSTPVVAAGRVFSLGIGGILTAFDAATGRVLWQHAFAGEFKSTSPEFGAAMSPLVDGENVIAHVGGSGSGALIAFAAASGTRKWTWKADGPAYASPVIATFGAARHLITQTQSHVVGLGPADGRELWRISFTTEYEQNIVTPVVADGMVIYAGLSKPTTAVRVVPEATGWKPQQVWQNADIPMYMSSPVALRGVLYGLTHRNRGQFFAVDIKSGKTVWVSSPRQGENAAITAAGDLLIATTTDGKIAIMRAGTANFELVRDYTVADSPIWAHPAFFRNGVFVKDAENLTYFTF